MSVKSRLKPWPVRFFLKRISATVILITFCITIAVIGLSIYMDNVGNFIISVEKDERRALALSFDNNFEANSTEILFADGMTNADNTTYSYIEANMGTIVDTDGEHNDVINRRYTAYTFYLKNESLVDVSYRTEFDINQKYLAVDGAVRVMVIIDGQKTIYAKPNADGTEYELKAGHNVPEYGAYKTESFVDDDTVIDYITPVFHADEVKKYTVVMWLEGWDSDCTDAIKGGAIRMTLNFSIIN